MEKYGVEIQPEASTKTAENKSQKKTCPACNTVLQTPDTVNVPLCPKCGTKPFEE